MTQPISTAALNSSADDLVRLKRYLIDHLSRAVESEGIPYDRRRDFIRQRLTSTYEYARIDLPADVRNTLFREILHEMLGYGPIQSLLDDPEVSEVMVNGPKKVYVEKNGQLVRTDVTFEDEAHVIRLIDRIVVPLGQRVDSDHPTVDARLPDGSRVNAVVRPVAVDGPSIIIRKFRKDKLSISQLVEFGSLTQSMVDFLKACVLARLNILISGGTGSGKTTLLNLLSGFIPGNERIITIEDAVELQLEQDHVLRMETKPPDKSGGESTTIRDLVRNALRMRPDRIILGECRGSEALDLLQAMNTGHDGSLTTLHANSPRDALSRLETMVLMAGMELPLKVLRQQISSAIDLIVQPTRFRDGTRRITAVTEVAGMEGDTVVLTDIFKYEQTGIGEGGKVLGEFKPTGIKPLFLPRLEAAGYQLGADLFGSTVADALTSRQRR